MSKIRKYTPRVRVYDISLYSKRRKKKIFSVTQKYPCYFLWIDGVRIKRTRVNTTYWFHMVDGKIDHYYAAPSGVFSDEFNSPGYCEGCKETPIPIALPACDESLEPLSYATYLKSLKEMKYLLPAHKDPLKGSKGYKLPAGVSKLAAERAKKIR